MKIRALTLSVTVALGLAFTLAGCARSSHRSLSTYEYNEEPARAEQKPPQQATSSEYQMVSPGEMVVE